MLTFQPTKGQQMSTITEEELKALPVGSLVSYEETDLEPDYYDDEGKLLEGFIEKDVLVRTGYHYFHEFVSVHSPSEWDSKNLIKTKNLKVVYVAS
jgi:hypothetical protein